MSFLAAGHETTASAISWALYLLAQHPIEQDLLREELVKAFPDKLNFNPTFDEINSLEYLNCVFKETLRLIPSGMFIIMNFFYQLKFVNDAIFILVTKSYRSNIEDKVFGEYFIPKVFVFLL